MKKVVSWEVRVVVLVRVAERAGSVRSVVRPEGSPTEAVALPTCAGVLYIAGCLYVVMVEYWVGEDERVRLKYAH